MNISQLRRTLIYVLFRIHVTTVCAPCIMVVSQTLCLLQLLKYIRPYIERILQKKFRYKKNERQCRWFDQTLMKTEMNF